jgi:SAM-dependent methyltransferase
VTLPLVFLVVAFAMTLLGEITGRAFLEFTALDAYRWDIVGSLSGTLLFTLVAFLRSPSWIWPTVMLVALVLLYGKTLPIVSWLAAIGIIVLLAIESLTPGVSWSPYYKVTTQDYTNTAPPYTAVQVNGIPHQNVLDAEKRLEIEPLYGRPYERAVDNPLRNVLVIGAGTGTDVALALSRGAQRVDAVEIDPRIQQIGIEKNPNQPYADPRVTTYIDDGRAFLSRTDNEYDLILFALPDSLTLVSGASQLRLESYLFTRESIQEAYDHLSPDGVFAMYNYYREDWLINRLAGTVEEVFGHAPCIDRFTAVQSLAVMAIGKSPENAVCDDTWERAAIAASGQEIPAPSADDRPFLYLKDASIPQIYLLLIGLILAVSLIAIRVVGGPLRQMRGYADLFLMGMAFLLLETRSITTFALLFGTTWLVNALVFAGVLLAVLLAIEVTRRYSPRRPWVIAALFISLAIAWLVPNAWLLTLPVPLRLLVAVVLAFAPIFCANLYFTSRFKEAANPTAAFAANLFGAMIGGTLEYLSLLTGYRFLLVVAAVIYLAAVLVGRRLGARAAPVGA